MLKRNNALFFYGLMLMMLWDQLPLFSMIGTTKEVDLFNAMNCLLKEEKNTKSCFLDYTWSRQCIDDDDSVIFNVGNDCCIDSTGLTYFEYALRHRRIPSKIVRTYLKHNKVDIHTLDYDGNTPLHTFFRNFYEFESDYVKILNLFKKRGARFDIKNNKGNIPEDMKYVRLYTWDNVPPEIQEYISRNKKLYSLVDQKYGQTLLMHMLGRSCENYPKKLVEQWISQSAPKLLAQKDKQGNTLLHYACENFYVLNVCHPKLIPSLVEKGLKRQEKNRKGKICTQLFPSIAIHSWKDFDRNKLNYMMNNPHLLYSMDGINITVDDVNKETYISYYIRERLNNTWPFADLANNVKNGFFENIERVINIPDKTGNTPLHYAYKHYYEGFLQYKYKELINYLVKLGASLDIKNNEGIVPSEYYKQYSKIFKDDVDGIGGEVIEKTSDTLCKYYVSTAEAIIGNRYKDRIVDNHKIVRQYKYSPRVLKGAIDAFLADESGDTNHFFLNYLLKTIDYYDVSFEKNYLIYNPKKIEYDDVRYDLFKWFLLLILKKGYDFKKQTITTLQLLGKNFCYMPIVQHLISTGINCSGKSRNVIFCSGEIEKLANTIVEYDARIKNVDSLKEFIKAYVDDVELLSLLFSRAIFLQHKDTLKLLNEKYPKHFTPMLAFEIAMRSEKTSSMIPFIFQAFRPYTLYSLCMKSMSSDFKKKCRSDYAEKIFAIVRDRIEWDARMYNNTFYDAYFKSFAQEEKDKCAFLSAFMGVKKAHLSKDVIKCIVAYLNKSDVHIYN